MTATMTKATSHVEAYESSRQVLTLLSSNKFYAEHLKDEFLQQTSDIKGSSLNSKEEGDDDEKTQHSDSSVIGLSVHNVESELTTMMDFFTKLKFNYLEQETKEKFLKAILDDPPTWVEPSDKESLDQSNKAAKKELKESKTKLEATRQELLVASAQLSDTHSAMQQKASRLSSVFKECDEMELELAKLKAGAAEESILTVEEAEQILESQTATLQSLASRLQSAKTEASDSVIDCATVSASLPALYEKKSAVLRVVEEARANQAITKKARKGDQSINIEAAVQSQRERLRLAMELWGVETFERIDDRLVIKLATTSRQACSLELRFGGPVGRLVEGSCRLGDALLDIVDALNRAISTGDLHELISEVQHRAQTSLVQD